ncbi:SixA phosphatase family protein [Costertonia aggregata]|uniref:phosphoglycerate mutase (2,3-diphosphoglycerate-dependent) n=1 Tax=Costertonia aggregata TaxID=343403 RepID=A0A7H9ASQ6_9FLAO|nr:phosphoglycerate mutase family protein [Costertonia aggregata]QLG46466.1 histidine phosphatase family protein [Costertonia aggregata]
MKTLILVRHGKSSWEYNVGDKDRPLLERGIRDGDLVSSKLREQHVKIDAVYSSPANRALHTCMIFLRKLDYMFNQFQITNDLYDFSGDDVFRFIKSIDNTLDTVMIFGHNHAFTHIANSLGNTYIENVPTTGLVQLTFDVLAWSSVDKGITKQTIFPKHLKA